MNYKFLKPSDSNLLMKSALCVLVSAVIIIAISFLNLTGTMKIVAYAAALAISCYYLAVNSIECLFYRKFSPMLIAVAALLTMFLAGLHEQSVYLAIAVGFYSMLKDYLLAVNSKKLMSILNCAPKYEKIDGDESKIIDYNDVSVGDKIKIKDGQFLCFSGVDTANGEEIINAGYYSGEDMIVEVASTYDTTVDFEAAVKSDSSKFLNKIKKFEIIIPCAVVIVAVAFALVSIVLNGMYAANKAVIYSSLIGLFAVSDIWFSGIYEIIAFFMAKNCCNEFYMGDAGLVETLGSVANVVINKNGGLMRGAYAVSDVFCAEGYDEKDILSIALSVQPDFDNPFAKAFLDRLGSRPEKLIEADYLEGLGLVATITNKTITVGSAKLMAQQGIDVSGFEPVAVFVAADAACIGAIKMSDRLSKDAKAAVEVLNENKINVCIVSADNEQATKATAKVCGNVEYMALCTSKDKADYVSSVKKNGITAYLGDDERSLNAADFGVCTYSHDDFSFVRGDSKSSFAKALISAKKVMSIIKTRFIIGLVLNVLFIVVAMAKLVSQAYFFVPVILFASMSILLSNIFIESKKD